MKYSCRASLFQPSYDYELEADRLVRRGPSGAADMRFADIAEITVFKERRFGSSRTYWACTIAGERRKLRLTSARRRGALQIEDRTASYIPFIKEFERRALANHPSPRFVDDEFRETLGTKISSWLSLRMIGLLGGLPRRWAASICGTAARCIGPMLRGHRHARRQLQLAFPGLGPSETRRVLRGMWDNIGRTFAEYGHIPELMTFSTDMPAAGQVVMNECTAALARRVGAERRGALVFAAHLGNWEIPAMAARVGGRKIALAYKRQPSSAMTKRLIKARSLFADTLVEAGPTAPLEIIRAFHEGWLVGMLVDQHYAGGMEVTFLGHTCQVNPILAHLARSRDWPVYGARAVRLPDQRYRFELVGPLEFPRDPSGKIEVQGAMQMVFGVIEAWIREYPEQWMWVHRIVR
jgi:Kdo2-lipid IVA lauroyltransferase/acyltransferase